jgi:hypothetical protein
VIAPGVALSHPVEAERLRFDLLDALQHGNEVDIRVLIKPYAHLDCREADALAIAIADEAHLEGHAFLRCPGVGTLDWILTVRLRREVRVGPAPAAPKTGGRPSMVAFTLEALRRCPRSTVGALAQATGMPPQTVRTHLWRHRDRLQIDHDPLIHSNRYSIKEPSWP